MTGPQQPIGTQFASKFLQKWAGVNNTMGDEQIDEQELSDARNYQPDFTGAGNLIKTDGTTRVSSNVTGTTYSVYGGKVGNYFHNGSAIYSYAGTSLASVATAYDTWTSFAGKDIVANGTNALQTADGSTFTDISGWPAGVTRVASVNNFLYFAGHDKGKLRWCDLGTTTATLVNEYVLTQDENDDIVAIAPWNNSLLVLCYKSFGSVMGTANLAQNIGYWKPTGGCVNAPRSVVTSCPFGAFWWSAAGLCWCKSDLSLDYPMLRKLSDTLSNLNRAQDAYVHSVWDSTQHRIMTWVFYGLSQTTCNLRIDYYPEYDALYLRDGAGAAMSASGTAIVSGLQKVYVGGYGSTYLYQQTGDTDDGSAITSYLKTKREGDPTFERRGRRMTISTDCAAATSLVYQCEIDNEESVVSGNSWTNVVPAGKSVTTIGINREHTKIRHTLTDSSANRTKITGLEHSGYNVRLL